MNNYPVLTVLGSTSGQTDTGYSKVGAAITEITLNPTDLNQKVSCCASFSKLVAFLSSSLWFLGEKC